jgi:hypothetical protein
MQISNQQAVATDERRLAFYEWRMARASLRGRQVGPAALKLRTGWQHYWQYFRLRHSLAVTDEWVSELLETSAPVLCLSETGEVKRVNGNSEHGITV